MDVYKNQLIAKLIRKTKSFIQFYVNAIKDIDKEYNLVLEKIIFSPKFQKKIPIIRLIGSGGYIIETAENIIKHDKYKCHLHPDDLLKINKLAIEIADDNNSSLLQENFSGEIYLSNGENINIYKPDFDSLDLDKIFSLPKQDIARLLESRGFNKGRKIANEVAELKNKKAENLRANLKLIK